VAQEILTEPICQDKGRVFRKGSAVEDKEEFGAVLAQSLQRVRNSAGEVLELSVPLIAKGAAWGIKTYPEIALLQVIHEVAAFIIQSRDAHLSIENIRPLSFLVPMELASNTMV